LAEKQALVVAATNSTLPSVEKKKSKKGQSLILRYG
jgi:hypothetical protein